MGIRIEVGDGNDKPKPTVRISKDLNPSSVPDRASSPARSGDPSMTPEKMAQRCDKCGGPFRNKHGVPGSKRVSIDGKETLTCASCKGRS